MVEAKFDEIVMLVHPLYDEFISALNPIDIDLIALGDRTKNFLKPDELKLYKLKKAELLARIKVKFGVYGETLLKYKNKPNSLIVLFEPIHRTNSMVNWRARNIQEVYDNYSKRFYDFCEKNFKGRFLVSSFANGYGKLTDNLFSQNGDVDQKYFNKLNKKVKIVGFGEFIFESEDGCVNDLAKKVKIRLEEKDHIVISKDILANKSLGYYTKDQLRNITKENAVLRKILLKVNSDKVNKELVYKTIPGVSRNSMNKKFNLNKGHKILVK